VVSFVEAVQGVKAEGRRCRFFGGGGPRKGRALDFYAILPRTNRVGRARPRGDLVLCEGFCSWAGRRTTRSRRTASPVCHRIWLSLEVRCCVTSATGCVRLLDSRSGGPVGIGRQIDLSNAVRGGTRRRFQSASPGGQGPASKRLHSRLRPGWLVCPLSKGGYNGHSLGGGSRILTKEAGGAAGRRGLQCVDSSPGSDGEWVSSSGLGLGEPLFLGFRAQAGRLEPVTSLS